jgi:hypothetical protein
MTLALPLALSLLLSAPPAPPPAIDWSRIPDTVGVSALTPPQKDVLARVLADEVCYCGCPHTLLGCLTEHQQCSHAPRMAALAARLAGRLGKEDALAEDVGLGVRDPVDGVEPQVRHPEPPDVRVDERHPQAPAGLLAHRSGLQAGPLHGAHPNPAAFGAPPRRSAAARAWC